MLRKCIVAVMAMAAHGAAANPDDTVARVRELRQQASAKGSVALLEQAQRMLKAAEQATGNPLLYLESYNNLLPLAAMYSRMGDKEQALAALEQSRLVLWYPGAAQILAGSDFDSI